MKLAFLHVSNHKALENIDIPINSSHKCSYSDNKLTLQFSPDKLDYYQGLDCSAIIGKNGVGKSTILDFLEVSYEGTDSSGIIVWFDSKKEKYHICTINLYIDENSIVSNQDYILEKDLSNLAKRHKIKLIKANNLTGVETNDFSTKRKSNSFIYDMTLSQYVNGSKRVVAQRTNRLISYFNTSVSFNKSEQPKVKFTFQFSASSTAYLKSLLNNKDFVSKHIGSKEHLDLLKHQLNDSLACVYLHEHQTVGSQLLRANLLSICNYLSKLNIIRKDHRDEFFIKLLIGFISGNFNESYIANALSSARRDSSIDSADSIVKLDAPIILFKYQEVLSILGKVSHLIDVYLDECHIDNANTLTTFNADLIIELTNCITNLPQLLLNNFQYGWNGFSTGEFAKLNIFSELYNYIHDQKNQSISNHLIVMDEVDLYLHPDWQRTFFSELLEFTKIEFPKDTVQIILSTHSPIIISDFLPEDIVSLDRENGNTKVVESFGFSSNITDLYVKGMHLSSTFGEHSKKEINRLLSRPSENSLGERDRLLIKKIKSKNIQQMILRLHDKN
ncbi:AAA family ATPase [Marinomonas mediterranea]|uniref:AAA family ATPase n=1 Tax=Marinomonas mediterranea TaxID=119864 RepID=UPI00234A572E|nr:AAA family ATPase [Marinomonas mediterranea]WCN09881.1 AAA family ATPase [Marinomonas mediterranea]